jgi:IclR family acetate operon transcriptional repressor
MQKTGTSVCLATLDETNLELLSEQTHQSTPALENWRSGLSRASHATAVGKAILAWLPETQIARVVAMNDLTPFTDYTIRTLGELVENLRQIRRHGFSVEDREFEENIVGIACALRDASGGVVGAIGCLLSAEEATSERLQSIRIALTAAAAAIAPSIP